MLARRKPVRVIASNTKNNGPENKFIFCYYSFGCFTGTQTYVAIRKRIENNLNIEHDSSSHAPLFPLFSIVSNIPKGSLISDTQIHELIHHTIQDNRQSLLI